MKTRNLLLAVIAAIMVINTLFGTMVDSYDMETSVFVNLSLILSAGLFCWLYTAKLAKAIIIIVTFFLILTGLIRIILLLCGSTNGIILTYIVILMLEVVSIILSHYITSK